MDITLSKPVLKCYHLLARYSDFNLNVTETEKVKVEQPRSN
jgi:hypothetical protein